MSTLSDITPLRWVMANIATVLYCVLICPYGMLFTVKRCVSTALLWRSFLQTRNKYTFP